MSSIRAASGTEQVAAAGTKRPPALFRVSPYVVCISKRRPDTVQFRQREYSYHPCRARSCSKSLGRITSAIGIGNFEEKTAILVQAHYHDSFERAHYCCRNTCSNSPQDPIMRRRHISGEVDGEQMIHDYRVSKSSTFGN